METFAYTARTLGGRRLRGHLAAANRDVATDLLQESGVFVISITPVRSFIKLQLHRIFLRPQERLMLLQSWATYLQVGLPMQTAILRLRMSTHNRSLSLALDHVQSRLDEGKTLSEALKLSRLFPLSWVGLIEIGEKRGDYAGPMMKLHAYVERTIRIRREFVSMLMMPLVVLGMVALWALVFVMQVVPTVTHFLAMAGASTVLLVLLQSFAKGFLFLAQGVGIFLAGAFLYASLSGGSDKEMGMFQRWVPSWIPVVGPLVAKMQLYVVASSLQLQLVAGIDILQALETLARGIQNRTIRTNLLKAHGKLMGGASIAEALSTFPGLTSADQVLLVAGEKSSKLPQILSYVKNDAEATLMEGVKRLVILLRSAVILGTGTMVGLLVISYFTVFVSSFVALK